MNQRVVCFLVLIGTPILNWIFNRIEEGIVWLSNKFYEWNHGNYPKNTDGLANMPILTYINMKKEKGGLTYTDMYKIKEDFRRRREDRD